MIWTLVILLVVTLLVESVRQGLYTLPVLAVLTFIGLYLYAWWVRRAEARK